MAKRAAALAVRRFHADSASGLSRRLLLYRAGREVAQILVQTGRADHLDDIRLLRAGRVLSRFERVLCCLLCAITLCEERHSDAKRGKIPRQLRCVD